MYSRRCLDSARVVSFPWLRCALGSFVGPASMGDFMERDIVLLVLGEFVDMHYFLCFRGFVPETCLTLEDTSGPTLDTS